MIAWKIVKGGSPSANRAYGLIIGECLYQGRMLNVRWSSHGSGKWVVEILLLSGWVNLCADENFIEAQKLIEDWLALGEPVVENL